MMQNSSVYSGMKAQVQNPQFPFPEQLKCPRCESTNTKFCYYNNYNLSQPRHFCKNCKRYWTKGGVLRNVPVGGGSRKKTTKRTSKRPQNSSNSNNTKSDDDISTNVSGGGDAAGGGEMTTAETLFSVKKGDNNFGGQFGDFSSSEGQFGNSIDGLGDNGFINEQFDYPGLGQTFDPHLGLESGSSDHCDGFLNIHGGGGGGDPGCWSGGSNEWPNVAIYTPGSTFQ